MRNRGSRVVVLTALLCALLASTARADGWRLTISGEPRLDRVEIQPLEQADKKGRKFKGFGTLFLGDGTEVPLKVVRKLNRRKGRWRFNLKTPRKTRPRVSVRIDTPETSTELLKLKLTTKIDGKIKIRSVDGHTFEFCPTPEPVGVSTTIFTSSKFLYEGPDAVQTGVTDGAIQPMQAAIVRGVVHERGGAPLSDVNVTVLGHTELARIVHQPGI